jgi:hypothetical protein
MNVKEAGELANLIEMAVAPVFILTFHSYIE